jgi:hypothetical protein
MNSSMDNPALCPGDMAAALLPTPAPPSEYVQGAGLRV